MSLLCWCTEVAEKGVALGWQCVSTSEYGAGCFEWCSVCMLGSQGELRAEWRADLRV
jgi:hypothetical protein